MTQKHLTDGAAAEQIAEDILNQHGLNTLCRNFRCCFGEIDLIMDDHGLVAFVEVRYRKSNHFGGALTSVHKTKQRKLIKTAQFFLATQLPSPEVDCRFDVIALGANENVWLKNAFIPPG